MRRSFSADPGAVLLLGLLLFALRPTELLALISAALAHEFGHVLALRLCGVSIRGVSFTLSGPVLRVDAAERRAARLCCALAGPAAGFILWAAMRRFWPLCSDVSLLLSAVNLLPVLPLDGGRALEAMLPERIGRIVTGWLGFLIPGAILVFGLCAVRQGDGAGPVFFGAWLLLLGCQGDANDVKWLYSN